jgi:hypothetical protein
MTRCDALRYPRSTTQILSVSAIVLANLCVSYIMTSQTDEAEELMRKIEKEEENVSYDEPDKKIYHLCIVNLVIGYTDGNKHDPCGSRYNIFFKLTSTCLVCF